MKTFEVDIGGKTYEVDAPDANTAWNWAKATHFKSVKPLEQIDVNGPQEMPMFSASGTLDQVKNLGMGALKGASRIGNTVVGSVMGDRKEREKTIDQFFGENSDPNSLAFKTGDIGTQIAGTAGATGALAKGVAAIPALAKFAPAIQSGGFNLGSAATGSKLANGITRAGSGAVAGAAQTAMVSPDDTLTGAGISALAPGAVYGAGKFGDALASGGNWVAEKLMQSALKPGVKALETGKAQQAVETLLREGVSPTKSGVEKLGSMIDDLNNQVKQKIANSGQTVSKKTVLEGLNETGERFAKQASPASDLAAIAGVGDGFVNHPLLPNGDAIPVQLAQELKTGTYRALKDKAYGEVKGADTEAQKAIARALKEEIERVAPSVAPLNQRQSDLVNALKLAQRRSMVDANKNPLGLTAIAPNSLAALAFLADRSAAFKGLTARGVNQMSKAAATAKALENFSPEYGLLGAPAVLSTSP